MTQINLIECLNFTWQGEGPDTGKKMLLLRFKHCDRSCLWCDVQVKLRITSESQYNIDHIKNMIKESNLGVLITGGEPTFKNNLDETINIINETDSYLYNVETNGKQLLELISEVDENKNIKYILSPKLFNENDYLFYKKLTITLKNNKNVFLKIVYENTEFNNKFLDYLQKIDFDSNRIYLMPEGKTRKELIEHSSIVFDMAEKYKFNFTSRQHIIYNFL